MASPSSLEVQCAIHCATEPNKKFFSLCRSIGVRFACSVGRKDKVLGSLHNWNEVRKAEALPGRPVQERTRRAKPPVKRHCRVSNPGSPVYKTGALTSYATAPCWIQLSLAAAEGWFANQIASGTGAPLHHWRFSAPPFAFRSRIEKPLSPR